MEDSEKLGEKVSEKVSEALSSETRKKIMRRLMEKPRRPADLSRELEKDRSTIIGHLKVLSDAGLVERTEREGHKWIFYRLSPAGQSLFPNQRRRIIYIAIAVLSLVGAFLSMLAYLEQPAPGRMLAAGEQYTQKAVAAPEAEAAEQAPGPNSTYIYAALALLVVFLVAAVQALIRKGDELAAPKGGQR